MTTLNADIDLRYHSNNCSVCNHPECKHIEDDYANFMEDEEIAKKYGIKKQCLKQHCLALRLWVKQAHNIPMMMVGELKRGLKVKPKPRFADLTALAESIRKDLGLYQHRDVSMQLYQLSPDAIRELAREALRRSLEAKEAVQSLNTRKVNVQVLNSVDRVATIEQAQSVEISVPLTEHSENIVFTPKPITNKKLDENT